MGTRGAVGFFKEGENKITYNHFDSYPSGLGNVMKEFVMNTLEVRLDEIFDKIVMIDGDSPVSTQDRIRYKEFLDENVSDGKDWYSLLRNTQGRLEAYRDTNLVHMIDNRSFMQDSLFCEWAYIYNLDTSKLEIYRGFQKTPQENRYKFEHNNDQDYYQVALLREVHYADLPYFDMDELETLTGVSKDLEGSKIYFGYPADEIRTKQRELAALRHLPDFLKDFYN